MYSREIDRPNIFLSWPLLLLKLLALVALSFFLDKPVGGLEGSIALEKEGGFHLYSLDLNSHKVYAMAIGPRGNDSIERGVWVKPDGTFKIDQLPVGEYQLKVRAPGYGTEYVEGLFIEEAKSTDVPHVVKLSVVQPSISIATNVRVFTSKDKPSFWVNGTGLAHAKVRVYKHDIIDFNNLSSNFSLSSSWTLSKQTYDAPFENPLHDSTAVLTFDRDLPVSYDDSSSAEFKTDKPLPAGDYILEAEGTAVNGKKMSGDISWFTVTDLGIIVKHAPDQALVRAINIVTLKPVANAIVKMGYDLGFDATKKTDKDGFASFKMEPEYSDSYENKNLDFMAASGPQHAYGDVSYYLSRNDKYEVYFYEDRPVYRLGQTVYFKGLVREKTVTSYKNPQDMPLSFEVKDPDGNVLSSGDVRTNKHGSFHGLVQVPKDSKTGDYGINITFPDGMTSYQHFEIMQYRKPEYQVEVKALTPRLVSGEHAKAKVHATYYFGGPVANAKVKYTINESTDYGAKSDLNKKPAYYDFFDDWETTTSYGSGYGGEVVTEGFTQTDANGDAQIEFDTKPVVLDRSHPYDSTYSDRDYSISVEVTDISRLTVSGSGSLVATEGDFALFVKPKSYVYGVGDPLTASIKAVGYDGKPIANQKVNVRISRWPYDISKHEFKGEVVAGETTVTTDADGKADASFTISDQWPSDTFYVSGTTQDSHNHLIFDSGSMWIANGRYPYVRYGEEAENEAMSIKLDKDVYQPGETAKVMITAPLEGNEGADAIVSVEGKHIWNYRVVPMNATAKMVQIPLKSEYAPNVFVNVTIVDKHHKMYTQDQMIRVSPENNFLSFAIKSDKQKYKPGETVHYTVTAKHNDGRPAKDTEISFGVVDESIYAIRAEFVEDIQKAFYRRTENAVTTICSFPEEYSGGPDKNEPKVRKDFKDTAFWNPELVTDDKGIVNVNVKLPDNLTTWRATVRGIDMQTDVGETTQKIMSTQDLILRLALPRFFSQGDEGLVTAVVHNYAEKTQDVKITLSMTNQLTTTTPLTQTLHLDPEKAGRFSWPVTVTASGTALIRAKAVGQIAGDAMETKIPVRPLGIPAFSVAGGLITEPSKTITLPVGLSSDAERSTAKYQVNLASSTIGPVIGNYAALIDYPYGCTEQTMSRLMPSIVAKTLAIKLKQPISKDDAAKFEVVYKEAMDKLTLYHHNDGSWGWWQYDEGNPYLTALVVEGLQMLKDVGYDPGDSLISTGVEWMKKTSVKLFKELNDPKLVKDYDYYLFHDGQGDLARMLYAESLFNKTAVPAEMTPWQIKEMNDMTPETLSYLTMAYHNSGDDANAKKFYDRLIYLANVNNDFTDWQYTKAMQKKLSIKNEWLYSYRYTYVETTALALRAVLAMDPDNLKRIESIKRYILLQRGKDGWDNTKTTSEVFHALLQDELQARDKFGNETVTARVSLDSKTLADFVSDSEDLNSSQIKIDVPIPAKRGELTIEKMGNGRLYWNTMITYRRNLHPGDHVVEKGLPQGLKITRSFFRLKPKAITSDGTIHYNLEEIKDGEVKAGETIMMKVFVETPITVPYIMLDAALPSGGEVVEDSPEEGSADQSTSQSEVEGDWGMPWWTHKDVLDDRIVFFGTKMSAGKNEFHTMLRMELPGKINLNPVALEGMYTDNVRGYSDLATFHVTE